MKNKTKWLIGGNLMYVIFLGGLGMLLDSTTTTIKEHRIVYELFGISILFAILIWTLYCIFNIKN